ncbi:MAG TPA: mannose-1-phosphate guanylyltransferase [Anaeromyxobacteraceae bacterium]|nr:mannose-1-phosphate guanylyltransferase [Anaeromyxobacteraceae bacterium]
MKIHAVVMAGGSGTRFWPLSRQAKPKQFLPLAGKLPLLAETVKRLPPLAPIARTYVACGPVHARGVRKLLPKLPRENLLVEPVARNTAPCVGLAAIHVARRAPDGILAMLPADHHVSQPELFREAIATAARIAAGGDIVTIGITPSRPETGYGYLEVGAPLAGETPVAGGALPPARVKRFVEKPDRARAEEYLRDGGYLWNSGIFVFRADVILDEIARAMPELAKRLGAIAATLGTRGYAKALAQEFPACPSESIDYGVMERSSRIAVVPADFGWSDVGSFAAIPEVRAADGDGNVATGDALVIDGKDNVVLADAGRLVAVVGASGLVVVDAGDALLVCPRERAQDVKRAVDELKRRRRQDLL